MIELLKNMPKSHKQRLQTEHLVLNLARHSKSTQERLKKLLEESKDDRQAEIESCKLRRVNGKLDLAPFYEQIKLISAPNFASSLTIRDEMELYWQGVLKQYRLTDDIFDAMFSGEESAGRYFDLIELHRSYQDLLRRHGVKDIPDYESFLDQFDRLNISDELRCTKEYETFCKQLSGYLSSFILRTRPLFDLPKFQAEAEREFSQLWEAQALPAWESVLKESIDPLYCEPCKHQFTNEAVYKAHLDGKKHRKNSEHFKKDPNKFRACALYEFMIQKYTEFLSEVKEETLINLERKELGAVAEESEDVEEEPPAKEAKIEDQVKGEEEKIYNPKKLPLDWDGKPIPYWLWKLHGLGFEFPCEVCGNHVYKGRMAFDLHFTEWRHMNSMKSLGIPYSRAFYGITKIEDVQSLWETIKARQREERFKPETMEECEDAVGNVYTRKTFEDLRKQGLI